MNNINNLIEQNQWKALEQFLENQEAYIGKFGGRYISSKYSEVDSPLDLSHICWQVFEASEDDTFKQLPLDELVSMIPVIEKLRRLYNQATKALGKASYTAALATRVYDFGETFIDRYPSLVKLEVEVLPELKEFESDPIV